MKKAPKDSCSSKVCIGIASAVACCLYVSFYQFSDSAESVPLELTGSFDIVDAPSTLYGVCPLPRHVPTPAVVEKERTCEPEIPLTILNSADQIVLNPLAEVDEKRRTSCYARPLHDSASWPWTWMRAIAVFFSRNRYLFWYKLADAAMIKDDFVDVECLGYNSVHGRIRRIEEIPKRANNTPDVYIIHVRSLKSIIFTPQTARYLEEALDAVHFHNYQSLGDDYADFGAILTGGLAVPLSKERIGTREVSTNLPRSFYDDPCFAARTTSYLPRIFQQDGYATLIADENSVHESSFVRGCGWDPSSLYMPLLHQFSPVSGCKFANRVLGYFNRFIDMYDDNAKFAILRILLNDEIVDDELKAMLMSIKDKLNDAYVFFIADVPGERNPSPISTPRQNLWISVPDRLKDSVAMARLLGNQHTLTTPFDAHATLRDVIRMPTTSSGSSLLGKLPSTMRDCLRLPIPLQHCPCPMGAMNYTDTATLFDATEAALAPLSELLYSYGCKRWDIQRIYSVRRLEKLPLVEVHVAVRPAERNGGFTMKYERFNFPVFKLMVEERRTASTLVFTGVPQLSVALKPTVHSLSPCIKGHWLRPFCYCEPWML